MSNCRSCGEPIIWAVTAAGKRMPVDAEPAEGGNVLLNDARGSEITAEVGPVAIAYATRTGKPLHKSHFATCVNANQHRKPR